MGKKKQVTKINADEAEYQPRLQAVLLADDFAAEKFQPISLERPKVLFPLVHNPMIDYTLAWLRSSNVKEVYVVCCAHSKQVIEYLEKSEWLSVPEFTVTILENRGCVSVGDALRFVYQSDVINGDFVLVSGDIVTNMNLTQALKEHRDRKKKHSNAIMTMVIKKPKPSRTEQTSKDNTDGLVMGIHRNTKELLRYGVNGFTETFIPGKELLPDNPNFEVHSEQEDCHIDICSPVVLSLFADNFDYQHLRRHLVKGLLDDDVMGYKIFTYEIHQSRYAARVDDFKSYDTISKDVIQRWTYPYVPDIQFSRKCAVEQESDGIFKGSGVQISSFAHVGPDTYVGNGTSIGDFSKISNSVIGKGCCIGSHVKIENSYIWDNVTVQNSCQLNNAFVSDGVVIKSGVALEPGVVLSFKVVVGAKSPIIPAYSKVSLHPQPTNQDSDEELDQLTSRFSDIAEVGVSGDGYYFWSDTPRPEPEMLPAAEITSDDESFESDKDHYFDIEVAETILRAALENEALDDLKTEVTALRLSYNMTPLNCAGAVFSAVMKLALQTPYGTNAELLKSVVIIITTWRDLLKHYIYSIDEQFESIMKFEEMCSDSARDFAPLFEPILRVLYDKDVLDEDTILSWASEKDGADASDKVFVNKAQNFITGLKEAEVEDEEQ
ncbi:translation initiation factor eIF-2B subunit epsilon-like [Papaver somniferum]|uniref:translation initiation factor eIF-2B subunit epsilon-like n=1 Tax=Papaver somniferum TaxID=3469 RepID=UPI000E703EED|nr:translation initiation factor eIF-2B subunit epsilon-like [Papaver somniferum]